MSTMLALSEGIHDDIPNEVYHQEIDAVSSTTLKGLLDPSNFGLFDERGRAPFKRSAALDFGTVAHSILLEGDASVVRRLEFDNYRSKAAQEARDAAYAEGLIPLKPQEQEQVDAVVNAVRGHGLADALLTGHVAEQTFIRRDPDTGVLVKVRTDARTPGIITDLKTAMSANPVKFQNDVIPERGYDLSAALYVDTVQAITGEEQLFFIIAVEKADPFRVSVIQIGDEYLEIGRRKYRHALELYRIGRKTGQWPDVFVARPPTWVTRAADNLPIDNPIPTTGA